MVAPRLLLDQGLPRFCAAMLRNDHGWDVLHVAEVGLARASDALILERARLEDRVCVTLDADFHALLALSAAASPSVVRIRIEGLDGPQLAELLLRLWQQHARELARGAVLSVSEHSARLRHLPIGAEPDVLDDES
jgi:predicted nuclease of predicted toxin-antitoxin system